MNKEVLHSAVAYLARREHAEKELTEKLLSKEYNANDIAEVIDHLKKKNYQSDLRYAESYQRNRINKGYGWLFIKNALRQQDINHEIMQTLQLNDEIDWYLQAELAYNKRFGEKDIKDVKDKAKRIRFLQYRGFSTDQIMAVVNRN